MDSLLLILFRMFVEFLGGPTQQMNNMFANIERVLTNLVFQTWTVFMVLIDVLMVFVLRLR
jgi:prolipoprotein diacylglyceryltransferase